MTTIQQAADWIVANRGKGKAFVGYSYTKILQELIHCSSNGCMVCIKDDDSKLVGIVCGAKDDFRKVFHVYDILTTKRGVLHRMVGYFRNNFPGFTLQGMRNNGTIVAYNNIDRLAKLTKAYGK